MARSSYGAGDAAAETLGAGAALLALALLALLIYLVVKALNLLIRVFAKYPRYPWLWGALLACLVSWSVTGLLAFLRLADAWPIGLSLAVVATVLLLVVARVVELRGDELLQPERETLAVSVLKRPWWTAD